VLHYTPDTDKQFSNEDESSIESVHAIDMAVPEFHVSEPADIYIKNILDKFPRAGCVLAQRLGEANWQRLVNVRSHNTISEIVLKESA
jgi:hypothetical protein